MTKSTEAEKVCPLCGADNECAMAAGKPAESCWCQEVTISPAALAAVPEDAVDRYCLCPACGRKTEEPGIAG